MTERRKRKKVTNKRANSQERLKERIIEGRKKEMNKDRQAEKRKKKKGLHLNYDFSLAKIFLLLLPSSPTPSFLFLHLVLPHPSINVRKLVHPGRMPDVRIYIYTARGHDVCLQ